MDITDYDTYPDKQKAIDKALSIMVFIRDTDTDKERAYSALRLAPDLNNNPLCGYALQKTVQKYFGDIPKLKDICKMCPALIHWKAGNRYCTEYNKSNYCDDSDQLHFLRAEGNPEPYITMLKSIR